LLFFEKHFEWAVKANLINYVTNKSSLITFLRSKRESTNDRRRSIPLSRSPEPPQSKEFD